MVNTITTIITIIFSILLIILVLAIILSIRQVVHNHKAYIKSLHKHCIYCNDIIKKDNPNYDAQICTKDECMLMEYHKNKQGWPE